MLLHNHVLLLLPFILAVPDYEITDLLSGLAGTNDTLIFRKERIHRWRSVLLQMRCLVVEIHVFMIWLFLIYVDLALVTVADYRDDG